MLLSQNCLLMFAKQSLSVGIYNGVMYGQSIGWFNLWSLHLMCIKLYSTSCKFVK